MEADDENPDILINFHWGVDSERQEVKDLL